MRKILLQITSKGKMIPPNEGKRYEVEITTGHTIVDEDGNSIEYPLTLQEESHGTQLLFFYGPHLKDAFEKGKTLILDEIDKSMHPSLVKFIMNLFRDPDINKAGAQLIVTTHQFKDSKEPKKELAKYIPGYEESFDISE